MKVYVDEIRDHGAKGYWCHMAVGVNSDPEELHKFAASIGLKREWFQAHPLHPHYDLRPSKRTLAIQRGTVSVSCREFVKLCSKFVNHEGE